MSRFFKRIAYKKGRGAAITASARKLADIDNATKSLRIITPFLTDEFLSRLIDLEDRLLDIQLITSDQLTVDKGDKRDLYRRLVKQTRLTDMEALTRQRKYRFWHRLMITALILTRAGMFCGYMLLSDIRNMISYGVLPLILFFILTLF